MSGAKARGLARLVAATRYSAAGLRAAWFSEEAFRQETVLAVVMTPLGLALGRSPVERALLIASCLLVLVVELLNSAVEAVVDRIGPERHELAGRAKDMGSAAVLLSLLIAAAAWGAVAWERFGHLLQR